MAVPFESPPSRTRAKDALVSVTFVGTLSLMAVLVPLWFEVDRSVAASKTYLVMFGQPARQPRGRSSG